MNQHNELENKYILFYVGNGLYGIDIAYVSRISEKQDITWMPELPPHMLGVINLRGSIIPIMSLMSRFNAADKELHERTCFIIINIDGGALGLAVSRIRGIEEVLPEDITENKDNMSVCISGIAKSKIDDIIMIVDPNKLFVPEDVAETINMTPDLQG